MHGLAISHLAADAGPLNISGIQGFLGGVLGLVILVIAIHTALHAMKGAWYVALTAAGIVGLGAMLYGLASSGSIGQLGTDLLHMVLKV